jgi:DNA-binding beta-propeller fold protein YncE
VLGFAGCSQDPRIAIPQNIAFSPDGGHVYVAARDRVVVFARQPLSGVLSSCPCRPGAAASGGRSKRPARVSSGPASIFISPGYWLSGARVEILGA